jgi:virginiamycin B lyase
MSMAHERRSPALLLAAVLALGARDAHAGPPMTMIDTGGNATNLAIGTNGTLYWTELLGDALGYRTPSGVVGHIALPAGSGPLAIAAADDGSIWLTEDHAGKIGRYRPNAITHPILEWTVGAAKHPVSICAGPDGNMWFVESVGNAVGRMTPTGVLTEFPVPTASALPQGIALGADGHLWFTEANAGKIGRIGATGVITEYDVPSGATSHPTGITLGPDGNLWFTERGADRIGRITRSRFGSVTIAEFPAQAILPNNIATGPDDALWFTTNGARLGRISTSGDVVTYNMLVSVTAIGASSDGGLWFSEPSEQRLCRVSVSGDVNRDGATDVADFFHLINYLFAGGDPPK